MHGDANNYIIAYGNAANSIRLYARVAGGGALTDDWDCTGAFVADEKLLVEIEYKHDWIQLRVNGLVRATIVTPVTFTAIPALVYWGSYASETSQADATFDEP